MDTFTEYDLIQMLSGTDEYGVGKSVVGINLQRCDAEGELREVEDEFITEKPIVQVFKQAGGYVLVDLIFESIEDVDLKTIFLYLKRFTDASASVDDDELDFPLLSLSIAPKKFDGAYWVLGLNPIFYALTPEDTTGEPRIIRMAFISQDDPDALPNFLFLSSQEEELEKLNNEVFNEFE